MRRNNTNRRGPIGNPAGPGGPLMTDHLKDIDLELELLKRKRDMIEQQQHLLAMEQQFQSSSRHYDFEPHSSNRDFAHLYDNGSKNRGQFGRKRQPEPQWQYENSSKRTPPKRKGTQPQFNPRMGQVQPRPVNAGPANFRNQRPVPNPSIGPKNFPRSAVPLMSIKVKQSVGQKIANQNLASKPNPPRKQITQNKVTKPKAAPAPNKLAAQPIAERKKLVSAATEAASQVDVTRMLLPDKVPTQQVSGRLELALGAIMKNIRESVIKDSPHASMLRSVEMQRVMKQAVRERIKTVMLGKVVGSMLEILGFYREEFPPETDVDIVNIALEAIGMISSNKEEKKVIIESENPEHFFKMNMCYLLESRLTEMFKKLEKIYGGENPKAEGSTVVEQKTWNVNDSLPDSHEDSEEFKQFLDSNIKPRDVRRYLPRLMKKNLPYIIKLLHMDTTYQTSKAAITTMAHQRAGQVVNNKEPVEKQAVLETAKAPASPIRPVYNLPFYVKIMGRPSLPKKKVMQTFLSQFNPKSIKKHRTIHNLLFVGFSEKSDQDAILASDGTVIGRISLSVRMCGKGNENSSNDQNKEIDFSLDISQSDLKMNDSSDSDLITPDLDGQITDLLSSIRNETENVGESTIENKQDAVSKQGIQSEEINESQNDIVMKELDDINDGKTAENTEAIPEKDSIAEKVNDQPKNVQETTDKAENKGIKSADATKTADKEIPNATAIQNPKESNDTDNKSEDTNSIQPCEESSGKETEIPAVPADEVNKTPQPSKESSGQGTDTPAVPADEVNKSPQPSKESSGQGTDTPAVPANEVNKTSQPGKESSGQGTETPAVPADEVNKTSQPSKEATGQGTDTPAVPADEVNKTSQQSKEETKNSETKETSVPDTKPVELIKETEPTKKDDENTKDSETALEQKENDRVEELKSNGSGRSTPTRSSARKANVTPSTIRTRRASRLAQN